MLAPLESSKGIVDSRYISLTALSSVTVDFIIKIDHWYNRVSWDREKARRTRVRIPIPPHGTSHSAIKMFLICTPPPIYKDWGHTGFANNTPPTLASAGADSESTGRKRAYYPC